MMLFNDPMRWMNMKKNERVKRRVASVCRGLKKRKGKKRGRMVKRKKIERRKKSMKVFGSIVKKKMKEKGDMEIDKKEKKKKYNRN